MPQGNWRGVYSDGIRADHAHPSHIPGHSGNKSIRCLFSFHEEYLWGFRL